MEIVTYVRTGAITHQDSMGNKGRTGAGDVQVMSAGTGVTHAEYNLEDEADDPVPDLDRDRQAVGAAKLGRHAVPEGFARRRVPAARQRRRRRRRADHQRRRPDPRRDGQGRQVDRRRCRARSAPLPRAERPGAGERGRGGPARRRRDHRRGQARRSPPRTTASWCWSTPAEHARRGVSAPFIHAVLE